MPETFERGKKYQVVKKWSREPVPGITTWRFSVEVGEILRFMGPNWDGAYFRDAQGKTIVLPAKVAFRIMGNLTPLAADVACTCSHNRDGSIMVYSKTCPEPSHAAKA
jgi:hypothetical protein